MVMGVFFLLYSVFGTWGIYLSLQVFMEIKEYHKWSFFWPLRGIYDTIYPRLCSVLSR
jgi:hypothetical protein